jgi:hypothetical protein
MNVIMQSRFHKLIENFTQEELERVWNVVYAIHCDYRVLEAIQEVKRSQQPWDTLTQEEAVRFLTML